MDEVLKKRKNGDRDHAKKLQKPILVCGGHDLGLEPGEDLAGLVAVGLGDPDRLFQAGALCIIERCGGCVTSQNRYSAKCHGTGRCRGTGASRLFDWPKKGRGALHPEGVHDVGIAVRANSCYPVLLKGRKGIPGSHIARVNRRVLYLSGGEFRRSTPLLLDPSKFGDGQVSERWRNGGRRAWYSSHWGSPSYGVNHAFVSDMSVLRRFSTGRRGDRAVLVDMSRPVPGYVPRVGERGGEGDHLMSVCSRASLA